ncbi:hypothetical protein PR003_g22439 [Phytophthora rubi]|uniref:Uncharacterized protein n=1 Tax=Phytophthora rubi TaxID=129364 RepID=A0A6A4D430_9STRA|nr:hypothetical protein PR003_g22439 [Phytophthora rubi]
MVKVIDERNAMGKVKETLQWIDKLQIPRFGVIPPFDDCASLPKLLFADTVENMTLNKYVMNGEEIEGVRLLGFREDLEITIAAQLLEDDDSDAEDSDEGLFRDAIASYRYLTRSTVFKAAHWTPGRIFRNDPMRARRDLRMSRGTFIFLLGRIQHDVVFVRAPTKK